MASITTRPRHRRRLVTGLLALALPLLPPATSTPCERGALT
jgi:hypothetical protein